MKDQTIMRTKLMAVALALLLPLAAEAQTHMLFVMTNFNVFPVTNRFMTIQLMQPFNGNLVTYNTSSNGYFWISNMVKGDYDCHVLQRGSASEIGFQVTVTSPNMGVINAISNTSTRGVMTYPISGKSAWTIDASESKYGAASIPDGSLTTNKIDTVFQNWVHSKTQTNISWTAVTNLTSFNAITNHNTGAVTLDGVLTTTNEVMKNPQLLGSLLDNDGNTLIQQNGNNTQYLPGGGGGRGITLEKDTGNVLIYNPLDATRLLEITNSIAYFQTGVKVKGTLTATNAQLYTPTLRDSQGATVFTTSGDATYQDTVLKVNGLNFIGAFFNDPANGSQIRFNDPADATLQAILTNHQFVSLGGFVGNGAQITNLPITSINGSGGTGTAATNGTVGQVLSSAGNGGVYWATGGGGGGSAQTNIAVVGVTNAGTIAYSNANAYVTSPTNSGTDGQFVSLTGDKTKWISVSGGGDALTGNPLSQFASTTSLQFAGVISDETGTGLVVLNTNAQLFTPNIGNATATSLTNSALTASRLVLSDANKKMISAAASGAVPVDADGTATTIAQLNALTGSWIVTNSTTANVALLGGLTATNIATAGVTISSVDVVSDTFRGGNTFTLQSGSGVGAKVVMQNLGAKIITTGVIYGDGLGVSNVVASSYPAGLTNHQSTAVSFDSTVTATNAQLYTPTLRDSQGNTTWSADNNGTFGSVLLKMNAVNLFGAYVSDPTEGNVIKFADAADGLNAGIISNKVYISKGGFVGNGYGITNIPGAAITNLGTIAYSNASAYVTSPTNSGTDGQFVSLTGNKTKWISVAGGGDALTGNPLSQFAATTSLQFAGVISDETGTGKVVLNTNASLATPSLIDATATSITNSALTANRMVFADANKKEISAAASGSVPLNADGSASTSAQVQGLFPSVIHTNGMSVASIFSNNVSLSAASFLSISNATASRVAMLDTAKQLTNASAASAASPINSDGTASTFAQVNALAPSISGIFITNNGNGYTNAGNIQASSFNGNGAGITNIAATSLPVTVVTNNGTLTTSIPLAGDGGRGVAAANSAMIQGIFPGVIHTNGMSVGAQFSNNVSLSALAFLSVSNATASRMAMLDAGTRLTNATASGAVSINADGTATTFAQINALGPNAAGIFITNNGSGYTNSGNIQAASFNGDGKALTNLPITALNGIGGANTAATNGAVGQVLISAGNGGVYWSNFVAGGSSSLAISNGLLINPTTRTNLLIGVLQGGAGASSSATNGLAGMILNSSTDGGVFWDYPSTTITNSSGISGQYANYDSNKKLGATINGSAWTNIPVSAMQGSGGAGTPATNGSLGQMWTSAANGGGYWSSPGGGSQTPWVGNINGAGFDLSAVNNLTATNLYLAKTNGFLFAGSDGKTMLTNGVQTVFNVLDFGATLSGDQSSFIQLAVNRASTNGGVVYIPARTTSGGTWNVYNTVHVPPGVTIQGDHFGPRFWGTQIYANNRSGAMFMADGEAVAFKGLMFVDDASSFGAVGIQSSTNTSVSAQNVKVEDCFFYGLDSGVKLQNAWGWDIISSYSSTCKYGIYASNNVNAVHIVGGRWAASDAAGAAIYIRGGANYNWDIASTFESQNIGILITNWNFGVNIHNSYFEGNTNSVYARGEAGAEPMHGFSFQDNILINTMVTTNIVLRDAGFPAIRNNPVQGGGVLLDADGSVFGLQMQMVDSVNIGAVSNKIASVNSSLIVATNMDLKGGNFSVWNSNDVSRIIIGTNSTGFSNSRDMFEIWSPGNVKLLDFDTNGWLEVTGTFSVTGGITNTAGTASRLAFTDANKKLISAAASGAVPVDADGSATTIAQVNALTGSFVLTNNLSAATVISNTMNFSALAFVSFSNATASRMAIFDTQKRMTNAGASGAVSINADGSATTFAQINALGPSASGIFITNNGAGYTNSGNIQAATFNGAMTITSESYPTNSGAAVAPDFTKRFQSFQTNQGFAFLAPIGVQVAGTVAQVNTFYVTNSSGSGIVVTPPANVRTNGGSWTVGASGLTKFLWEVYGRMTTNCTSVPIF